LPNSKEQNEEMRSKIKQNKIKAMMRWNKIIDASDSPPKLEEK